MKTYRLRAGLDVAFIPGQGKVLKEVDIMGNFDKLVPSLLTEVMPEEGVKTGGVLVEPNGSISITFPASQMTITADGSIRVEAKEKFLTEVMPDPVEDKRVPLTEKKRSSRKKP